MSINKPLSGLGWRMKQCFCFLHITYGKPYFFLQRVGYTQ